MAELPIALSPALSERLASAFDIEGKIVRALDALGPVAGRDVVLVDGAAPAIRQGLDALAATLVDVALGTPLRLGVADGSADAVIGLWSPFRGVVAADLAEADRVLRPGGRVLAVHDYGRDDVSALLGERPEYGDWSRRDGPFLRGGFRVRVLHCWWTFASLEVAASFLEDAFGELGAAVAAGLKRPRLSYKVAIYHRSRAEPGSAGTDAQPSGGDASPRGG
jgi:SAM-dependent methyltransferase